MKEKTREKKAFLELPAFIASITCVRRSPGSPAKGPTHSMVFETKPVDDDTSDNKTMKYFFFSIDVKFARTKIR